MTEIGFESLILYCVTRKEDVAGLGPVDTVESHRLCVMVLTQSKYARRQETSITPRLRLIKDCSSRSAEVEDARSLVAAVLRILRDIYTSTLLLSSEIQSCQPHHLHPRVEHEILVHYLDQPI